MTASKPVTREDQRKSTRRRIVNAARVCFYQHGPADVSMEQIARATLYLHFPNRDALLMELLSQNLTGVARIFADLCAMKRVDLQGVRHWLQSYVDTLREHRDATRLMHVGIAATDEARTLIHGHHLALADRLVARFPALHDETVRSRTRLMLMIGRIDDFASAAAAKPPRIDPEAGLELVSEELMAMIAPMID
ncbi:helix-turn-helix domain-containing protein [Sphingobium sp.]|uniref:TetR/AcrR family transcriptional regulator n=1 Tax=Sphingobium sp. TaxID=1912891 RepID=UPI002BE38E0B|nr:helix-turn-helix domain-containing protein [Sphingobium sp.]HUD90093.1 helix-turn-helix domain-containing protein [Sphingobium sp.]